MIVETLTYSQVMDRSRPLLTLDDLARYVGVPKRTVYSWRYRGIGPVGIKLGGHVRYRWDDVEKWLDEQTDPQCNEHSSGSMGSR